MLKEALSLVQSIKKSWIQSSTMDSIVRIHAQAGKIEEAIALARLIENNHEYCSALALVAAEQAYFGRIEDAIALSNSITDEWWKSCAIRNIVEIKSIKGQINDAISLSRLIKDKSWRSSALVEIAVAQIRFEKLEEAKMCILEALDTAILINDDFRRDYVLGKIAGAKSRLGCLHEALALVNSIGNMSRRALALGKIAESQAQSGQAINALNVARSIEDVSWRAYALRKVATAQFEADQVEMAHKCISEIMNIVRSTNYGFRRAAALGEIAGSYARIGQVEKALSILCLIDNDSWRNHVLIESAESLAKSDKLSEALVLIGSISDISGQSSALGKIALATAQAGGSNTAQAYMSEAVNKALLVNDAWWRDLTLGELSVTQAKIGFMQESISLLGLIKHPYWHAVSTGRVAAEHVKKYKFKEAIALLHSIEETSWRTNALREVAVAYVLNGQKDEYEICISEALNLINTIENPCQRIFALQQVAAAKAQAGQALEAITLVKSIHNLHWRTTALAELAEVFSISGHRKEANSIISEILHNFVVFDADQRLDNLDQLVKAINHIHDSVISLTFLHDYWPTLTGHEEIVALLPAATPLIIAHPPLLQELLDGFDWVDQVLTKW